jgi:hypothetical protein
MVGYEHLKLALGKVLSIPPWHCTADASSAALSLLIYEYPDVQEHLMQHTSPHAQNTHTHTHVHITHTHAHACTYIYIGMDAFLLCASLHHTYFRAGKRGVEYIDARGLLSRGKSAGMCGRGLMRGILKGWENRLHSRRLTRCPSYSSGRCPSCCLNSAAPPPQLHPFG